MSNKQQTAVEWYDNEIGKLLDQFLMGNIEFYEFQNQRFKLEQQAKQMEKEQIIEAFKHGELPPLFVNFDAEQYYNETYGGANE
jgi:hypothetical protein